MQLGSLVVGPGVLHRSWNVVPDATLFYMMLDRAATGTTSVRLLVLWVLHTEFMRALKALWGAFWSV